MKDIKKELLFIDLENASTDFERKIKKLDTIIVYYLDEIPDKKSENDDTEDGETSKELEKKDEEEYNDDKEETSNEETSNEDKDNENKNDDNDSEPIDYELDSKPKEDLLPKEIKTLYRKIMMKTHPDKTKGKPYEEEYQDLYKQAVKAKNDNDKSEILYIAYKLKLKEVFEIDEEHFNNLKLKIKTFEMKSNQIDNNPFWVWYHTDNVQLKRVMIQQITKMRVKYNK